MYVYSLIRTIYLLVYWKMVAAVPLIVVDETHFVLLFEQEKALVVMFDNLKHSKLTVAIQSY